MKKLIFICLFAIAIMTSCCTDDYYKTRLVFDVCYPDTTIRYDSIFICRTNGSEDTIQVKAFTDSYKGSNYIQIRPGYNTVMETTAPIRLYTTEFKGRINK